MVSRVARLLSCGICTHTCTYIKATRLSIGRLMVESSASSNPSTFTYFRAKTELPAAPPHLRPLLTPTVLPFVKLSKGKEKLGQTSAKRGMDSVYHEAGSGRVSIRRGSPHLIALPRGDFLFSTKRPTRYSWFSATGDLPCVLL